MNSSKTSRLVLLFGTLAIGSFLAMRAPEQPQERVGPLPNGGFLLNSGWSIHPAGEQVPVDTFPMSMVTSRNGKYLVVLNGGYNPPSISVIDISQKKEIGRTPLPDAWLGLRFAPGSNHLYVGGGSKAMVYELILNPETGGLQRAREFSAIPDVSKKGRAFIGDVIPSPDGHVLYAANLYDDSISVINLQSGILIDQWKCGRRPYRLLLTPGGKRLIVSSWSDASVYQYDANSGRLIGRTRVAPHPTDMLYLDKPAPTESEQSSYGARLFVAAANTNNVYSFGVAADGELHRLESINVALTPLHPSGMTPSALSTDEQGTKLYVVCSDANAVAVADISGPRSSVKGFIPAGWYPTAVQVLDKGEIAILNGKGLGSRSNPDGPNPTKKNQPLYQGGPVVAPGYVAHIQTGTVELVPEISNEQLDKFSNTVLGDSPYRDEMIYGPITDEQVGYFAKSAGHASPIQHVLYIIKENRTYDQELGDLEKGNGDKSLVLFGGKITPNIHQLAREFITYDNFYENADVSADGHNWSNAGIAPDYTEKTWPSEYAGRKKGYDFEGQEAANLPPAGYLWDNALQAGLTVRDYGEWTENIPHAAETGKQIEKVNDAALNGKVDLDFRGFDLQYTDVNRAHEFIREWKDFAAKGTAPNLMVMHLGNDHTQGTRPGALTPFSQVADNDYALGLITEAVSHSKLWPTTAIFVIEDDAQNGPDHVDSHRAPALVVSPYTHRGIVDSAMYNQTSILRTMELILGLRPMTHFDAGARPMFRTFARQADSKAYDAIAPKVSLTDRNPANGPGGADSARMDFSHEDMVDDDELNAVLWEAIKHTEAPAPVRSSFVR